MTTEEGEIFATIKRNLLVVVPEIDPDSISMSCSLSDLGCNSIDRAEVLAMAIEELRINIPLYELHRGDKLGDLVVLLRRRA
jgi:polyketide biosynthesis acyl carrier protein